MRVEVEAGRTEAAGRVVAVTGLLAMPAFWDAAEAEGVAAAALLAAEAVEADAGRVGVPLVGPVGFFAGDLSLGGVGAGIESFPLLGFARFRNDDLCPA